LADVVKPSQAWGQRAEHELAWEVSIEAQREEEGVASLVREGREEAIVDIGRWMAGGMGWRGLDGVFLLVVALFLPHGRIIRKNQSVATFPLCVRNQLQTFSHLNFYFG
jgi:hypothetical protein